MTDLPNPHCLERGEPLSREREKTLGIFKCIFICVFMILMTQSVLFFTMIRFADACELTEHGDLILVHIGVDLHQCELIEGNYYCEKHQEVRRTPISKEFGHFLSAELVNLTSITRMSFHEALFISVFDYGNEWVDITMSCDTMDEWSEKTQIGDVCRVRNAQLRPYYCDMIMRAVSGGQPVLLADTYTLAEPTGYGEQYCCEGTAVTNSIGYFDVYTTENNIMLRCTSEEFALQQGFTIEKGNVSINEVQIDPDIEYSAPFLTASNFKSSLNPEWGYLYFTSSFVFMYSNCTNWGGNTDIWFRGDTCGFDCVMSQKMFEGFNMPWTTQKGCVWSMIPNNFQNLSFGIAPTMAPTPAPLPVYRFNKKILRYTAFVALSCTADSCYGFGTQTDEIWCMWKSMRTAILTQTFFQESTPQVTVECVTEAWRTAHSGQYLYSASANDVNVPDGSGVLHLSGSGGVRLFDDSSTELSYSSSTVGVTIFGSAATWITNVPTGPITTYNKLDTVCTTLEGVVISGYTGPVLPLTYGGCTPMWSVTFD